MQSKYAKCSSYLFRRLGSQERSGDKVRCFVYKANDGSGRDEHCVYPNFMFELYIVCPDRQFDLSEDLCMVSTFYTLLGYS